MPFPTNVLITQIDERLSDPNITPTKLMQLSEASKIITQSPNPSVANIASLPDPTLVKGKMLYVEDIGDYRYSDGVEWRYDFDSINSVDTVWGWGYNNFSVLGTDDVVARSSPVSVVGGFTDWCQVSTGTQVSAAVRRNGTLWAWGRNLAGALGTGNSSYYYSPVSVVGGFTDWCQVSAGWFHTSAVRQNGTLWIWGCGSDGKLGDNTTADKSSPVSVVGGFADWCQVSISPGHSAAVRQNGTLWAWGDNYTGQLGDASYVDKSSPVSVVGGFADWCQVSAGGDHTTAIRQNGTLWAWGFNGIGSLGDNTTVDRPSPVSVVGGFTDWCQVSAGDGHTSAVRQNGTLWAWGSNCYGRLGDNTIIDKSSPVPVVGGFTDWCQVSAGNVHSTAVRQNGTLWAWGSNCYGRLGDGTIVSRLSPVSVVGGFTDWCQVDAGAGHTIAIRRSFIKGF